MAHEAGIGARGSVSRWSLWTAFVRRQCEEMRDARPGSDTEGKRGGGKEIKVLGNTAM